MEPIELGELGDSQILVLAIEDSNGRGEIIMFFVNKSSTGKKFILSLWFFHLL